MNCAPTDNCGIDTVFATQNDFDCSDVGDVVVTVTVIDDNGNSATCDATVTVQDTTLPEAICQDITVYLDSTGSVSITAADVDNGSNDECGIILFADPVDFACEDVGLNTVMLIVRDSAGNADTCFSNVTVLDTIAPIITCAPNDTVDTDPGVCEAFVTVITPTFEDNCIDTIPPVLVMDSSMDMSTVAGALNDDDVFSPICDAITVAAPSGATVTGVTVDVDITHTWVGDVTISLQSPDGTVLTMMSKPGEVDTATCCGCNNEDVVLTFDDAGALTATDLENFCNAFDDPWYTGTAQPMNAFSNLLGEAVNGDWTLCVADGEGGDLGTFNSWGLNIDYEYLSGRIGSTVQASELEGRRVMAIDLAPYASRDYQEKINGGPINSALRAGTGFTIENDYNNTDNASDVYPIGSTTVTWTVTDSSGNSASCEQVIVVEDNENPVAVCNDTTIYLDAVGAASVTAAELDGGSTDNCSIVSIVIDNGTFACSDLGTNTVTLTVTDSSGNIHTCTSTVMVLDTIAPTLTCAADTTVSTDPGVCEALVTPTPPTIEDNCLISGTTTATGGTGVIPDNGGPADPLCDTITITSAPVGVTVLNATIDLDIAHTWVGDLIVTVTAPSGASVELLNRPGFDCSGDDITATFDDASGIAGNDECSDLPAIGGTVAPFEALSSFIGESINGEWVICISDNVGADAGNLISWGVNLDYESAYRIGGTANLGSVNETRRLVNNDGRRIADLSRYASVNEADKIANANISANRTTGFTVTNNITGTDDATALYPLGTTVITWMVTDSSGNVDSCMQSVTVEDNENPTVTCKDTTIYLDASGMVSITIDDIIEENTTVATIIGPNNTPVTITTPGNTDFEVPVTSATTINFDWDYSIPGTEIPGFDGFGYLIDGVYTQLSNDLLGNQTGSASVGVTAGQVFGFRSESDDNAFGAATAVIGNFDGGFVGQFDPSNWTETLNNSDGSGSIDDIISEPNDNCGVDTFYASQLDFDCDDIGDNPVTITVEDENGNVGTCIAIVTVADTVGPIAMCQDLTIYLDSSGNVSITAADVDNGSDDACDGTDVMLAIDISDFACEDVGDNTVTLTVTDSSGNSDMCTSTVTVLDTIAPTIECQPNDTVDTDPGVCEAFVTVTPPVIEDNCIDTDSILMGTIDVTNLPAGAIPDADINGPFCDAISVSAPTGAIVTGVTVDVNVTHTWVGDLAISLESPDGSVLTLMSLPGEVDSTCCGCTDENVFVSFDDASGFSSTDLENACTGFSAWYAGSAQPMNPFSGLNGEGVTGDWTLCVADANAGDVGTLDDWTINIAYDYPNGRTGLISEVSNLEERRSGSEVDLSIYASRTAAEKMNGGPMSAMRAGTSYTLENDYNGTDDASDVYPIGSTTVTWTVTDSSGNSASCEQVIVVEDNEDPVAVCNDTTIYLDASGNASVTAAELDGGSTDNCTISSIVIDNGSFTCDNIGANSVTLTVTDSSGNTHTCTSTVTVLDTLPPTAICQDITVYLDETGAVSITAADVDNGSSDVCDGTDVDLAIDISDFACEDVGDNTVTLTVTDSSGNSATCTSTVTVLDTIAPTIECQPNDTVDTDPGVCEAFVTVIPPVVEDNCIDTDSILMGTIDETNLPAGAIPDADINGPFCDAISVSAPTGAIVTGVTVDVNVTHTWVGDLAISLESPDGSVLTLMSLPGEVDSTCCGCTDENVFVSFDDASGFSSTDLENACTGFSAWYAGSAQPMNPFSGLNGEGVTGDWTLCVADANAGDVGTLDDWTINIAYDYPNGRTGLISEVSNLEERRSGSEVDLSIYASRTAEEKMNGGPMSAMRAGTSYTLENDYNGTDDASDVYPIGSTTVTWTVTDSSGNSASCEQVIVVEDNEDPVAVCNDTTIYLDGSGNASVSAAELDGGSTDNCTISSIVIDNGSFTCDNIGANSVTLTVTDSSGNTHTCISTVTVLDTLPPTATCQDITVYLDETGSVSIVASDVDGGSDDACPIELSIDIDDFACEDVGDNTVTLTVTDSSGNSATCTSTVTVLDTIAPMIECAPNDTVDTDPGVCEAFVTVTPPVIEDNCIDTDSILMANQGLSSSVAGVLIDNDIFSPICDAITVSAPSGATITGVTVDVDITHTWVGDLAISLQSADGTILTMMSKPGEVDTATCCGCNNEDVVLTFDDAGALTAIDLENFCNASDDPWYTGTAQPMNAFSNLLGEAVNGDWTLCVADGTGGDFGTFNSWGLNIEYEYANGRIGSTVQSSELEGRRVMSIDLAPYASRTAAEKMNGGPMSAMRAGTSYTLENDYNGTDDASDVYPIGSTTVTWTVTDSSGNSASCEQVIVVEDNEDPVAVCNDTTIYLDGSGNASVTAAELDGGSTDNCTISSVVIDNGSFTCDNIGANSVTLTVTDSSGNTHTCISTVTVLDTLPPTATCQDITVYLDETGSVSIVASDVDGGSDDACPIELSIDIDDFACEDVGDNTVTLTVTDSSGNSATCTSTVTVLDTIAPMIECAPNDTVDTDPGVCEAFVTVTPPVIEDNCIDTDSILMANQGLSSSVAGVLIDNDIFSPICDAITVSAPSGATITGVTVDVDITHTWVGDLAISLQSADGTILTMMSKPGEVDTATCCGCNNEDVVLTFDDAGALTAIDLENFCNASDDPWYTGTAQPMNAFSNLLGEAVNGDWTLCVADGTGGDFGTFNSWGLNIEYEYANGRIGSTVQSSELEGRRVMSIDLAPYASRTAEEKMNGGPMSAMRAGTSYTLENDYNGTDDASDVYPVGSTTVTWTVTDSSGNSASCEQVIVVEDNEDPVAVCQDLTVYLDASGNVNITAAEVDNGSTDNCTFEVAIDVSAFDCSNIGDNTVELTATDSSGNTDICTSTVTVLDTIAPIALCQDLTVYLDENGTATITVDDVDNGSSDICSTVETEIDNSTFGCDDVGPNTVTLTVTDSSGNSATCTSTVTVLDTIAPVITCPGDTTFVANNEECTGVYDWVVEFEDNCSGNVTLSSNYQPGDPLPVGTTTIIYTATDESGNEATCSFDVTIVNDLEIIVDSVVDVSCFGGNDGEIYVTVTGGTPPYQYRWSTLIEFEDHLDLPAGEYVLFVVDANGCTVISDPIEVSQPELIVESAPAVITNAGCSGEASGEIDITISGGTPPYSFDWTNGSTDEDPTGLEVGNHQVTITDDNGCEFISPVYVIEEPDGIGVAVVSVTHIECNGSPTGEIDITVVGGTEPYSFLWSDGSSDEDLTGADAGNYVVTVTDANDCEYTTDSITIIEESTIVITASTVEDAECNGDASGTINISVAGGSAPYEYLWSNGDMTQDVDGLAAGDYTVDITDAEGCTITSDTYTIGEPDGIIAGAASIVPIVCNGDSTGSIAFNPTGGTAPYIYNWSDGSTDQLNTGLPVGTYTVTIFDANGCSVVSDPVTLTEPTAIEITSVIITHAGCNGEASGSIDIEVDGGTPDYTYTWSDGSMNQDLTNAPAGEYTVTILDANGCIFKSDTYVIEQPGTLEEGEPTVVTNVSCNGDSDGAIDVTISGGTMPYDYQWNTGDSTEDLSGIAGGSYELTVTDANGCVYQSGTITVGEPDALSVSTSDVINVACFGTETGIIDVTVTGGTEPYSYVWSNGDETEDLTDASAGAYSVTITDANGCSFTSAVFTITELASSVVNISFDAVAASGNGADDGSITASASGGDGPYTYEWQDGFGSDPVLTNVSNGTYCMDVTDANGCVTTECADVGPVTGVIDVLVNNISLYPNPTGDFATLEINLSNSAEIQIEVVNVVGKVFKTFDRENVTEMEARFDLRMMQSGTYFFNISINEQRISLPIIVAR